MTFLNRHPLRENVPGKKWQDVVEGSQLCRSLIEEGVAVVCGNIFSDGKQKVLLSDATELCFSSPTCILPARKREAYISEIRSHFLFFFSSVENKSCSQYLYLLCIFCIYLLLFCFSIFVMIFLVQLMSLHGNSNCL